ncbi:nuclear transport factor 2 family protein [Pedobacter sp. NJ-S-72]
MLLLAIKERDIERLDLLLHEDLLFTNPKGQTITKKIEMEGYRSGDMIVHHIASQDQIINIIGDTAVVAVSITLEGSYEGESLDGEYRYIRVWKSISGREGYCRKLCDDLSRRMFISEKAICLFGHIAFFI